MWDACTPHRKNVLIPILVLHLISACSKTAGAHMDQGRGRTGLEVSLGPTSSGQTPCLLRTEGMAALLCLLPTGGHSHLGHEHEREVLNPICLHWSSVWQNTQTSPSLQPARGIAQRCSSWPQRAVTTTKVHSFFCSYTTIPSPPFFLHSGKTHFISLTYSGRGEPRMKGFFWWWWGIFFLYVFQSQWAQGEASPCKCAATLLRDPISPSGTLPGDTDEILGLPLDCTKRPWNCQVRRKGAVAGGDKQTAKP